MNLWPDVEHALACLATADSIPHRIDGEAVLLDLLPDRVDEPAPVTDQLGRLTVVGFTDVDCLWNWRELALLDGLRAG